MTPGNRTPSMHILNLTVTARGILNVTALAVREALAG